MTLTLDKIYEELESLIEQIEILVEGEKNPDKKAELEELRDYLGDVFEKEEGGEYEE